MDISSVLYTSNQILVNEDLEEYVMRFDGEPRHDLSQEVAFNRLSGCTMVMNKEMRDMLIDEENQPDDYILDTRLHDTWVMLMATAFGKVIYDKEGRILYRQHENNVIGAKTLTLKEKLIDKYKRLTGKKYKGNRSKVACHMLKTFDSVMSEKNKAELRLFSECNSIKGAIHLMQNQSVRSTLRESNVLLFLKCLLGWI